MTEHEVVRLGACPGCGTANRTHWGSRGDLVLHRCDGCTLVYADPQHRGRVLTKYLEDYDLAEHFETWAPRKAVLYERRLARLPAPTPSARRLCDVGCGDGQFLGLAGRRGWSLHGVELNPPAAVRARSRGAEIREGLLEEFQDLEWGSFDVVTAWDCIEHTPDPRRFADHLLRLMRPGAVLGLTTLNVTSLVARTMRTRWSMVVDDHFTYWSPASLVGLLESMGFSIEVTETYGLGRDLVTWMDRAAGVRRSSSGLATGAQQPARPQRGWDSSRRSVHLEEHLNRMLNRFDLGVGTFVLARRPPLGQV